MGVSYNFHLQSEKSNNRNNLSYIARPFLKQLQADLLDWQAQGASIVEVPHRSKAAVELLEETTQLFRSLLKIPDHFQILFMHGGARLQFSAIPMNLLGKSAKAIYLNTGYWSEAAAVEAKRYGLIEESFVGWAELAKPNLHTLPSPISCGRGESM